VQGEGVMKPTSWTQPTLSENAEPGEKSHLRDWQLLLNLEPQQLRFKVRALHGSIAKHDGLRLVALLLMKRAIHEDLMSEKLDALPIPPEEKRVLRERLSTVAAYRQSTGGAYFIKGAFQHAGGGNARREGSSTLGELFSEVVAKIVFKKTDLDATLQLANLQSRPVTEIYGLSAMAECCDPLFAHGRTALTQKRVRDSGDSGAPAGELRQALLVQAKRESDQHALQDYVDEAHKLVAAGVHLLDASAKDSYLLQQLASSPIAQVSGDDRGHVVIVYDVKASGANTSLAAQCRGTRLQKSQAQLNSNHSDSNHISSIQFHSTHLSPTQLNSTQLNSTQLNSSQVKSSQVKSSQVKSSQVNFIQRNHFQRNSAFNDSTPLDTQFNSIQFNPTQVNSIPFDSLQFNSNSTQFNSTQFNTSQFLSIPCSFISDPNSIKFDSTQFNSIS